MLDGVYSGGMFSRAGWCVSWWNVLMCWVVCILVECSHVLGDVYSGGMFSRVLL